MILVKNIIGLKPYLYSGYGVGVLAYKVTFDAESNGAIRKIGWIRVILRFWVGTIERE